MARRFRRQLAANLSPSPPKTTAAAAVASSADSGKRTISLDRPSSRRRSSRCFSPFRTSLSRGGRYVSTLFEAGFDLHTAHRPQNQIKRTLQLKPKKSMHKNGSSAPHAPPQRLVHRVVVLVLGLAVGEQLLHALARHAAPIFIPLLVLQPGFAGFRV